MTQDATPKFRVYALPGCNWCEKAVSYFVQKNVPFQLVMGTDPVINKGIEGVSGQIPPNFPVLVSFVTNEMILGFKEDEYARVIAVYHSGNGTGVSH